MSDLLVLGAVVVFGVWAVSSLRSSLRSDRDATAALRTFADLRGLRKETAPGTPPVREIRWEMLRRRLASSPADPDAVPATARYRGELAGMPVLVDSLWVRRRFVDVRDPWTRVAVELHELPPSLRVRPRRPWDAVAGALGLAPAGSGDAAFDRRFVFRGEGGGAWLTAERRAALVGAAERLGRVEIAAGRLCLVRRGPAPEAIELDRLASGLADAARALDSAAP